MIVYQPIVQPIACILAAFWEGFDLCQCTCGGAPSVPQHPSPPLHAWGMHARLIGGPRNSIGARPAIQPKSAKTVYVRVLKGSPMAP